MSEQEKLILVAVGPDSVGLVEQISEFVAQRGCNIDDSKMAVFVGEFALILLISGSSEALTEVAQSHAELGAQTGLQIWVKQPSAKKTKDPSLPYRLTASSMDHPGIVYHLSGILRELGINIESMETHTHLAPTTGTPIFRMEAIISVPAKLSINSLRGKFVEIERAENIDIELSATS